MSNGRYDIIVIGSGAGGGTLTLELAKTGKRILLLERGGYLKREQENWDPTAVFVNGRYQAQETWYGRDGKSFHPGLHYFVGGNTKVYGGALFRLREEDFGEIVHQDGISPAWPIGYDVFEPYYTRAEQLFSVHGLRGKDPTEPWASAPYPHPPSATSPASPNCARTWSAPATIRSRNRWPCCWTRRTAFPSRTAPASAAAPMTAFPA